MFRLLLGFVSEKLSIINNRFRGARQMIMQAYHFPRYSRIIKEFFRVGCTISFSSYIAFVRRFFFRFARGLLNISPQYTIVNDFFKIF